MNAKLTGQVKQPAYVNKNVPDDVKRSLAKLKAHQNLDALDKLILTGWKKKRASEVNPDHVRDDVDWGFDLEASII